MADTTSNTQEVTQEEIAEQPAVQEEQVNQLTTS
jgi:hypothetical protein